MGVWRKELAALVEEKMAELGLSNHEVSRRAKEGGFTLSNGTVKNIRHCDLRDVREDTLNALAYVFKVPRAIVYAAYHGEDVTRSEKEAQALAYFRELPEERQADAVMYLEGLFRQYADGGQSAANGQHRPARTTKSSRPAKKGAAVRKRRGA